MIEADLRGRHDLGEIVGYAYRVYGRNFLPLFLIAATTMPLQMLSVIVRRQFDDPATGQSVASLFTLPALLVTLAASAALVFAVNTIADKRSPEFGASLDAAIERYGAVLKSSLLGGFVVIAAMLFAFPFLGVVWRFRKDAKVDGRREWWMWAIPGALAIYLVVRWLFVQQAVMIEGERNWRALDVSAAAVRGFWWRALGVTLVIGIIEAGPIFIASATALAPALVEAIATSAVSALVLPFATAAQTLLYYDLRTRKEQADAIADRLPAAEPDVPGESP